MTLLKNTGPDAAEGSHNTNNNILNEKGKIETFPILRITPEGSTTNEESVACELPVTIILNNRELVTMLCYPVDLKYMAVGFLAAEGLLHNKDEIRLVTVDDKRGVVRVNTSNEEETDPDIIFKRVISSGCGRGASFYSTADTSSLTVESELTVYPSEVFHLVHEFQHRSSLYLSTHGIHSAALCDRQEILVFSEDIGRHNAIDKVFGRCILEGISTKDRIMVTSGRITSEILHKVARRNIPILISISAPTNLGVHIANDLGITLIASVRGKKMQVFTHSHRVSIR